MFIHILFLFFPKLPELSLNQKKKSIGGMGGPMGRHQKKKTIG